jgi:hypothetical protein
MSTISLRSAMAGDNRLTTVFGAAGDRWRRDDAMTHRVMSVCTNPQPCTREVPPTTTISLYLAPARNDCPQV